MALHDADDEHGDADHRHMMISRPRLAALCAMASQCWMQGRIDAAVRYSDSDQEAIRSGRGEMPFGTEGLLGGAYLAIGQPERWAEWCSDQLARGRDTHAFTRTCLVYALTIAGRRKGALAPESATPACPRSRRPSISRTPPLPQQE